VPGRTVQVTAAKSAMVVTFTLQSSNQWDRPSAIDPVESNEHAFLNIRIHSFEASEQ